MRLVSLTRSNLLVLGFAWFLLAGCTSEPLPAVQAVEGALDLRNVPLTRPLALRGEWLARAGVDSTSFTDYEYADRHWQTGRIEAYFRDQGFPDEGLVWYRLHLRLPEDAPPLKGYVQHADNAHALFAATPGESGRLLAESGRPALTPAATVLSRKPVVFSLPTDTALVLSWAVANYDYLNGGPFYAIQIGPADQIDGMVLRRTAMAFACYGLYLLIAFFFLLHWATHRRDVQSLAVGLLAFVMGIRSISVSGSLELLLPDHVDFGLRILIDSATYLSLNGLFAFVLWAFFPKEFAPISIGRFRIQPWSYVPTLGAHPESRSRLPHSIRVGNTMAAVLAGITSTVFVVIALAASPEVISHALSVARWISLGLVIPTLVVVGGAVAYRRPLAGSMAFGMLLLVAGGVHDVLLAVGVLKGQPYVITYTFLGFVLVQSYALARRNAHHSLLAQRNADALQRDVEQRTKELRAATIAAHAANLEKSRLMSAVSHELRTPLASILGYTDLLTDELDRDLKPGQREFLSIIRINTERLLNLINDLLDVAKLEAGRLTMHIGSVDLRPLLKEVVDQVYPLAREKGLDLHLTCEVPDPHVRADGIRLRQVVLNLLSNAVKFTEAGGVGVVVSTADLNGRPAVAIRVRDTGAGISSDFLPHVFDRFAQDRRSHGRTSRGTGLGLTISREFITRMNGLITAESTEGEGSTFTVVIPSVEAGRLAGARESSVTATGEPMA